MVESKSASQAVKSTFGSSVRRNPTLTSMTLNRSDHHDRSAAAFCHFRYPEVRKQIHTAKIHREALIPGFRGCFDDRSEGMNRRTIRKEIEAAKLSYSFLDDRLHLFWPTDVTQFSTHWAALCIGFLLQFAVCSSLDATREDTCASCGKPEGDSTADPAGPGDNGYFAEELLH
jgi:hypothetical protein